MLNIGINGDIHFVHETALKLSPVLSSMCSNHVVEGTRKVIRIPNENSDIFCLLLAHMHGDRKQEPTIWMVKNDAELVERLLDVYALANRYEVESAKRRVIWSLKDQTGWSGLKDHLLFFKTASRLNERTNEIDEIFQEYFSEQARVHLREMNEFELDRLSEMVELEFKGDFIEKLCVVLAEHQNQIQRDQSPVEPLAPSGQIGQSTSLSLRPLDRS